MATTGERDPDAYETILSGDIDRNGTLDANNVYHTTEGGDDAVIDGFTITMGYGNGATWSQYWAGGMWLNGDTGMTVRDCKFSDNYSSSDGGAIRTFNSSDVYFEDCVFTNNSTGDEGGAIMGGFSNAVNCIFVDNTASGRGGAVWASGTSFGFDGCTFRNNQSTGADAGAIYITSATGSSLVQNCTFIGNQATTVNKYGGAIYFQGSASGIDTIVSNCTFAVNTSYAGGAIAVNSAGGSSATPLITDCVFSDNRSTGSGSRIGGAMFMENATADPTIKGSVFCGHGQGAIMSRLKSTYTMLVENCAFVGNLGAGSFGGAMYNKETSHANVINCTFADNNAVFGAAIYDENTCNVSVTNSIFWDNESTWWHEAIAHHDGGAGVLTIGYSDVQGGIAATTADGGSTTDAGGNTNVNPLLASGVSGNWTGDGSYSAAAGQTTLTDSSAGLTPGALANKCLNPDTSQYLHYYVVTNSATTVTVWGDASSMGTNTAAYQVQDVHLKSQHGRYDNGSWVADSTNSPCIDIGHPNFTYALEPSNNGGRINMGTYGNTVQASKSAPQGTAIIIR